LTEEDIDELDDATDAEVEETEEIVVDQATAARTIAELQAEIEILKNLETMALKLRRSGTDKKWEELSSILQNQAEMFDAHGHRRKMVIFSEHRDTLNYLTERLRALLGSSRGARHRSRWDGPRGSHQGPGGVQAGQGRSHPAGHRRRRRRHQPTAGAPDGQL
jgi:hypothetical protein